MATIAKPKNKVAEGMNAAPLVIRLNQMNPKQRRLLGVMLLHGHRNLTLEEMGLLAFLSPESPCSSNKAENCSAPNAFRANSWARNSKRELVRAGYIRKVCDHPATYEVTMAPIGKYAVMRTDMDVTDNED
jgi:hypothetical protein